MRETFTTRDRPGSPTETFTGSTSETFTTRNGRDRTGSMMDRWRDRWRDGCFSLNAVHDSTERQSWKTVEKLGRSVDLCRTTPAGRVSEMMRE